ncbi:hypothetical protein KHC17_10070 [Agrobacterium salinitolerans]|uniref:hypothetical protein n=1 Tax=Agrobacterium salinitolerans TaxID=1183413 RepID=UPI001C23D878|nr:hypothetical protein [Agrobacterium salinitolerans]QXC50881.1 hypothetical protein KHC17_10070 [Agrobacterium salinitolerans]
MASNFEISLNAANLRKMKKGNSALLYLGIVILASGFAMFFGGVIYLLWLVVNEPAIIKSDFSRYIVTRES